MKKIINKLALAVGLAVGLHAAANATIITASSVLSSDVIDFEAAPTALVGNFYAAQGVTMAHISGGQSYNTGNGFSKTGTNFGNEGAYPSGELFFSSLTSRVGLNITTNDGDDTTLYAYLGSTLVGSETFNTFGAGGNGGFVGIEFLAGFDHLVIDTFGPINGAFAIDNIRFDAASVPEPATLALLALPLLGIAARRRKKV